MAEDSILQEAAEVVSGARMRDYAHPRVNFERIAKMWSVLLDYPVTPRDVARCMIALKLARDVNTPKRDNLVDIAGYAETANMLDTRLRAAMGDGSRKTDA